MGVIAKDTIFQAFMNVQKDVYKSFLPPCEDCSGCVARLMCLNDGQSCCGARSHYTMKCGKLGKYRCGCLADGACRHVHALANNTKGDEDCCSFQSHVTLDCPFGRKCGAKPAAIAEFV